MRFTPILNASFASMVGLSWLSKAKIELSSQVHGKNLNVLKNKVCGVFVGIEILFQNYKIIAVMMKLAQGESRAQRMDDAEVEFLERLRQIFGVLYIDSTQQRRLHSFINYVYCICVVQDWVGSGFGFGMSRTGMGRDLQVARGWLFH